MRSNARAGWRGGKGCRCWCTQLSLSCPSQAIHPASRQQLGSSCRAEARQWSQHQHTANVPYNTSARSLHMTSITTQTKRPLRSSSSRSDTPVARLRIPPSYTCIIGIVLKLFRAHKHVACGHHHQITQSLTAQEPRPTHLLSPLQHIIRSKAS